MPARPGPRCPDDFQNSGACHRARTCPRARYLTLVLTRGQPGRKAWHCQHACFPSRDTALMFAAAHCARLRWMLRVRLPWRRLRVSSVLRSRLSWVEELYNKYNLMRIVLRDKDQLREDASWAVGVLQACLLLVPPGGILSIAAGEFPDRLADRTLKAAASRGGRLPVALVVLPLAPVLPAALHRGVPSPQFPVRFGV
ncbi:hypothetical protein CB1_000327015 [Camelus ferus]|nr:hypothetical protein CB1_000327015 [Camelus ferus]